MRKHLLLTTVCCLFIVSNVNAKETVSIPQSNGFEFNIYGAARLNYNFTDYDYSEKDEDGSYSLLKQSLNDAVLGGSIALGAKINSIRLELEGFYNEKGKDYLDFIGFKLPAEIDTKGLFLNGYYDINTNSNFTPYITAGVGYTWLKATVKQTLFTSERREKDHDISWNAGLGVSYSLNENSNIDLGYKYINYGDFNLGDVSKLKSKANTITLGYRYMF